MTMEVPLSVFFNYSIMFIKYFFIRVANFISFIADVYCLACLNVSKCLTFLVTKYLSGFCSDEEI